MIQIHDLGYPRLSVGKLIEMLQKFDPSLPIAYRAKDIDGTTQIGLESYWEDSKYPTTTMTIDLEPCEMHTHNGFKQHTENIVVIAMYP